MEPAAERTEWADGEDCGAKALAVFGVSGFAPCES